MQILFSRFWTKVHEILRNLGPYRTFRGFEAVFLILLCRFTAEIFAIKSGKVVLT